MNIKRIFLYGILSIFFLSLFGCFNISNSEDLLFNNGDYESKIIIIDKNNRVFENNVEQGWGLGYSTSPKFIYIKTENDVEGIFTINKEFKKKFVPKKEYDNMLWDIIERYDAETYNNLNTPFQIIISIIDDMFEIKYYEKFYSINSYFSYDDEFQEHKEKYFKEYYLENGQ